MPVISLNDKRTDNERYKRTGKERKYHTAELFATGFTGVTDNLHQHWDFGNGSSYSGSGTAVTDLTGNGHNGVLEGSSNISFSTTAYGIFPVEIGRLAGLRHIITPNITFSYRPDFSNQIYNYY